MSRRFSRPLTSTVITISLISGLSSLGCGTTPPTTKTTGSSTFKVIRQTSGHSIAILFVHGVFGSANETFTAANGTYWPDLVKADQLFDNSDIYVYGYSSPWFKNGLSISQLADDLDQRLQDHQILDHSKIVFVSHSMGGLVTRSYLVKYQRKVAAKLGLLYFFATPSSGSDLARLATLVSGSQQLANMSPDTGDAFLLDLQTQWLNSGYGDAVASYCAYETKPYGPTLVVGWPSALGLCNKSALPLDGTHTDIVKPQSVQDKPHVALRNAFRDVIVEPGKAVLRVVPGRTLVLSYRPERRLIALGFRAVLAGDGAEIIEDMSARLEYDAESFVPFDSTAFTCDLNGRRTEVPFALQMGDLTCSVNRSIGGLSGDPLEEPGERRFKVTFETERRRGMELQFCVDLTSATIDELRRGEPARFMEARCAP